MWFEAFAVFLVSHLAGDYLLQTDFQAVNKYGGLGRDPLKRRALLTHLAVYTVSFAPGFVWLASEHGGSQWALLPLIAVPHLVQDDGRPLTAWIERVKGARAEPGGLLFTSVDQSFHILALFGAALATGI